MYEKLKAYFLLSEKLDTPWNRTGKTRKKTSKEMKIHKENKGQFYKYFRKYGDNFLIISMLNMHSSTDLN